MLTSYQASPGAYWDVESSEMLCLNCAHQRAEEEGVDTEVNFDTMFIHFYGVLDPERFQPVIGYSLDEMQAEEASERASYGYGENPSWWTEEDHEECETELSGDCGHELRPEYHYGCSMAEGQNVPAARWVPCSSCGAGDGQLHREGCEEVNR